MKVRALYRPEVVSADPDEALADAAGRMQYQEIGSLAVMEHGRLIGILTERDLARALADGIDAFETPVRSYMTEEPLTVTPETDAGKVAATMLEQGVRHLPVLEGGLVVGMVSARDLLSLEAWNAIGAR
jgi:CBS domain-containing protein